MNLEIISKIGLEKILRLIKENKCPFCATEVNVSEFKDDLSLKEYKISGLCQNCQDKTFK